MIYHRRRVRTCIKFVHFDSFTFDANYFCHNVIFTDSLKSDEDRFDQVFCLRDRGFDRVLVGCRARDRVGPKGSRRLFVIPHLLYIFTLVARSVRFPFSNVPYTHTDKRPNTLFPCKLHSV